MSTTPNPARAARMTIPKLQAKKQRGERITVLTAYDAMFARLVEEGGADAILVGDSLGMVVQGGTDTLAVTVDDIIYHTRAVVRGAPRLHIIADMPFMSYQADPVEAVKNAGRMLKEGGAQAVKLEGGGELCDTVAHMVRSGIPVMGHLGLTPQSVHAMGGFKVQGRETESAERIIEDARALQEAGAYALVLEGIPVELARIVTASLDIPTIGIGAGVDCDGQVLVLQDMLGMDLSFAPKFVKRYARLGEIVPDAVRAYCEDVRSGAFPEEAHTFHTKKALFSPKEVTSEAASQAEG